MQLPTHRTLLSLLVITLLAAPLFTAPPRPSPTASVSQDIGLSEVTITYARPGVKERAVWGELVPWDEVWRTGANEATKITLSHDARIEGKAVPAGEYGLFTIPGKSSWTVIINRNAEQWGSSQYSADEDALRIEVKPEESRFTERMEFRFTDVTDTSARILLQWEKIRLSFEIAFDTHAMALAAAREEVTENASTAYPWAQYLHAEELDAKMAVEFAEIAVQDRERYWSVALLARTAQRAGKDEHARELAAKAIAMAPEDNFADAAKRDAAKLQEEMNDW